ncbi:Preprotein translocase subunit SECE [Parasponia andersonii]|uniref:Preprotein translocase subunit SECE n=1 Tax=Parasponia andersonii TaxID=3476 RepID=A0A2P5E3E5_PARAD|nr:Preprotein translocase subunit SECE [Parasponia andersonii]
MALAMSVRFPVTPPSTGSHPNSTIRLKPASLSSHSPTQAAPLAINGGGRRNPFVLAIRAVDETQGSSESETVGNQGEETGPGESKAELSELGSGIKKAMEERKAAEAEKEEGLFGGVAEEIREIEWPAFGKVLGTTWVVLGVIAGSSVVLLTLNFVLAELSDQLFAGRGVQDFFS